MKKVLSLLILAGTGYILSASIAVAWTGRPLNIQWLDLRTPLLKLIEKPPLPRLNTTIDVITPVKKENITANVFTATVKKILAPILPKSSPTPTPTPTLTPPPPPISVAAISKPEPTPNFVVPSVPPSVPQPIVSQPIISQPKLNPPRSEIALNITKTQLAAEIKAALTKALGTAPYTDGTSYPYYPVYQQIANQTDSSMMSTGRTLQTLVTVINNNNTTNNTTFSGTLGVTQGGTGLTTAPTYGQVYLGNSSGGFDLVATSSLGLGSGTFSGTTDNITEGSTNKFYSNSLVIPFIHASTTIPKTYTNNTFTGATVFSGGVTISSLNGPLHANNGVVAATSSIGVTYGGTGLTSAPSYGQILVGNNTSGYTLTGTSSLGLPTFADITGSTRPVDFFQQTNYGVLTLTPTTTIPVWIKDQFFASSSAVIAGNVRASNFTATGTVASVFPYASTTALSAGTLCLTSDSCRTTWPTAINVDWNKQTNYNVLSLTPSTTIPVWFKDQIFASSSATIAGNVTANAFTATGTTASVLSYASSTALSASGTGYFGNILATGSSTFQNFTGRNATTTNATSTSFFATTASSTNIFATLGQFGTLSTGKITNLTSNGFVKTSNSDGTLSIDTNSYLLASNSDWNQQTNYGVLTLTPTTTIPVWIKDQLFASSSAVIAGNVRASNFTATGTVASIFPYASSTVITASGASYAANFVATASSTLQNFTAANATTTNATTTSFFATTASSTNLFATAGQFGTLSTGKITNLTTNGFIRTNNSDGTLSVDTNSYITTTNADWNKQTNFGVLTLTPSTTIPVWFKDQVFASSTGIFGGNVTANTFIATGTTASIFPYASTTAFTSSGNTFLAASTGNVGIGSTTPSSRLSVNGDTWLNGTTLNLASSSQSGLTINYLASTTNILGSTYQNAWTLSTTTDLNNGTPIFNISNTAAGTTTIGFFVSTSTGLTAGGNGNPLPSALKNYVIVGNGRVQAGVAIVKGGLCVDSDGWCTASTTGVISTSGGLQTANSDLAEIYYSNDPLEAGDIVASGDIPTFVAKAQKGGIAPIGIVSTKPGLILGKGPDDNSVIPGYPIALSGRVPMKVSDKNGAIKIGDYLMIGDTPGVGVKAITDGEVVAQALEAFSGKGEGKITVFVKNTFYKAPDASLAILKSFASTTEDRLKALETGVKDLKGFTINVIGSAGASLDILSDVNFFGRPYFMSDTVGSALIRTGARTVKVNFERDYTDVPTVQATLALTEAAAAVGADEEVFSHDIQFVVTDRSIHGFTIKLNKKAPTDITFSWLALAAKNGKLFTSEEVVQDEPQKIIEPAPVTPPPQPEATSTPQVEDPAPAPTTTETTPPEPAAPVETAPTPDVAPVPEQASEPTSTPVETSPAPVETTTTPAETATQPNQ